MPTRHDSVHASPCYRPLGRMPLYHPGRKGHWHGQEVTVEHVLIKRSGLYVFLTDRAHPVPSEEVQITPTELQWPAHRMQPSAAQAETAAPPSPATNPDSDVDPQQIHLESEES